MGGQGILTLNQTVWDKKTGSVTWQVVKRLCLGFSWEDELML